MLAFFQVQYVHHLQRKYSLTSFNLLGHTAPAQAATLLVIGPFLDNWLTDKRIYAYDYNIASVVSTSGSVALCWKLNCSFKYLYINLFVLVW